MSRCFFVVSAWLLALGCASDQKPIVERERAFFYWRTTFNLSEPERAYMADVSCKTLYVKFLDIGLNAESGEITPYSLLLVEEGAIYDAYHIVPCIFITNEVFSPINNEKSEWLSERIAEALESVGGQFAGWSNAPAEVVLDCDWTAGTRAPFFGLIERLKHRFPNTEWTATIRLHQYRNPEKTGVPPCSRGLLMLYNTGAIESPDIENSIFSEKEAQKYLLKAQPYPLPLDLALPAYGWAAIYRNDALWRLIPDPDPDWGDTLRFKPLHRDDEKGVVVGRVLKGTFFGGQYLAVGDIVKWEWVSPTLLSQAVKAAQDVRSEGGRRVGIYHLDSSMVRHISAGELSFFFDSLGARR